MWLGRRRYSTDSGLPGQPVTLAHAMFYLSCPCRMPTRLDRDGRKVKCVLSVMFILLHTARRAMAVAPLLLDQRYCFISFFRILSPSSILPQIAKPCWLLGLLLPQPPKKEDKRKRQRKSKQIGTPRPGPPSSISSDVEAYLHLRPLIIRRRNPRRWDGGRSGCQSALSTTLRRGATATLWRPIRPPSPSGTHSAG